MPRNPFEETVFILAPIGRDAQLVARTLIDAQFRVEICKTAAQTIEAMQGGAASLVVGEEALSADALRDLAAHLAEQPSWSDLPIIVLTFAGRSTAITATKAQALNMLGNVTLLERPIRPETLRLSVRAAWRARARQYQMRTRQESLQHAISELEQFAYAASHDLKEPLRSIGIFTELLEKRYGGLLDAEGRQYFQFVRDGAKRMEGLVEDLLVYTRTAEDGDDEPVGPTCGKKCLDMALDNLAQAIAETRAVISAGELPDVRIRGTHLYQLFQNLIGNAIKYRGDRPPEVHVGAERQERAWQFFIKDNGIGIEPQFRERIFGLFKRLHNSSQYSGTGLGLAICQRIVGRYGGRIWVESEPGSGSTFFFTIRH